MNPFQELTLSEPLACLDDVSNRTWVLLGLGELEAGGCYIADVTVPHDMRIAGRYDGSTGDVFACGFALDAASEHACHTTDTSADADATAHFEEPAVHVIGSLSGQTGQITVRQEKGNYLRICRWDRVDATLPTLQGAILRTLPQCGCGGSLGAPKLFASFAEMSAYHFCAFYLPDA